MSCVACSTLKTQNTPVIVETKTVLIVPPPALLADPPPPDLKKVVTTRDIVDNSEQFQMAFENALAQLKLLREWYKSQGDKK